MYDLAWISCELEVSELQFDELDFLGHLRPGVGN